MTKLSPARALSIAAFLMFIYQTNLHAFSGAGGECGDMPLQEAAMFGAPDALQAEIDRAAKKQDFWNRKNEEREAEAKKRWWQTKPDPTPQKSTEELRKNLVLTWAGCQGHTLLEFSATAGNLMNVEYLLNLGAQPRRLTDQGTLFMRCADIKTYGGRSGITAHVDREDRTKNQVQKKLAAYSLILTSSEDYLNTVNDGGLSALHTCDDPEAIQLYIDNGAKFYASRSDATPLDFRIRKALRYPGISKDRLTIAKILVDKTENKSVSASTEWHICMDCTGPQKNNACSGIEAFLPVSNPAIFRSSAPSVALSQQEEHSDRVARCRKLVGR